MWADALTEQEAESITQLCRQACGITGHHEIRAVIEAIAQRERERRALVARWQRAKGRRVA